MRYLVDSENVASGWVSLLGEKYDSGEEFSVTVLYTQKSPKMGYDEIMEYTEKLANRTTFFKCNAGKPNALDFQLVALIGVLSKNEEEKGFGVISNDAGFDDAIHIYSNSGIDVKRIPCVLKKATEVECQNQVAVNKASENTSQEKTTTKTAKKIRETQRNFLVSKCCVPKTLAESIRSALGRGGIQEADVQIKKSKAKGYKGDPNLKDVIVCKLREQWDEYQKLQ